MALFGKKEKEKKVPELPKLPELPTKQSEYDASPDIGYDFPQIPTKEFPSLEHREKANPLPKFPSGSSNDKFSQNTIKNAINGGTSQEEIPYSEKMENYEIHEKPESNNVGLDRRTVSESRAPPVERSPSHEDEPVFIRIDKFEESLKIFDRVKKKLGEIDSLLNETKELKEKEKEELNSWEEEIQKLKAQVEKVDNDIFSKIE